MNDKLSKKRPRRDIIAPPQSPFLTLTRVVKMDPDERPRVALPGKKDPAVARVLVSGSGAKPTIREGSTVVILVSPEKGAAPVILGMIDPGPKLKAVTAATVQMPKRPEMALLDGETVVLEAEQQIELRCGKSSIVLHKNGRVVIKGVDVVTRGTRANKVRGGTVQIN